MQLHNILITDKADLSPSVSFTENDSVIELAGNELGACLTEHLANHQILRGASINLILDQGYIRYQYFNLPLISSRKIRQILSFELDETLLNGVENYVFSYSSQSSKKSGVTEVGAYIIDKQVLEDLVSIFREFNLELRWVTSLENLMDLGYIEKSDLGNRIHVELSDRLQAARFFIYHNGFLTGVSSISKQENLKGDTEALASQSFIDLLNQKVSSIQLVDVGLTEISMSGSDDRHIVLNDHQEFEIDQRNQSTSKDVRDSVPEVRLDHPRRVNLIMSSILIIQELKKYSRSLVITTGILVVSLVIYMAATGYRGYLDHQSVESLEKQLNLKISKYLPKGTSKTNALYILNERVQGIKQEKERNRNFEQRNYHVSSTLTDLSQLKKDVPTLVLSRFSLNEQVIRFQGSTATIAEFDRLQELLTELFPVDTHQLKTNEKSRGDGIIEFSTAIQLKK